jgi:hypothetical protein
MTANGKPNANTIAWDGTRSHRTVAAKQDAAIGQQETANRRDCSAAGHNEPTKRNGPPTRCSDWVEWQISTEVSVDTFRGCHHNRSRYSIFATIPPNGRSPTNDTHRRGEKFLKENATHTVSNSKLRVHFSKNSMFSRRVNMRRHAGLNWNWYHTDSSFKPRVPRVLLFPKIVKSFTMFSDHTMFSGQRERVETNRAIARTGWRPCRLVKDGMFFRKDQTCGGASLEIVMAVKSAYRRSLSGPSCSCRVRRRPDWGNSRGSCCPSFA